MVSLYVTTPSMALRELSNCLGREAGSDSHDVGSQRSNTPDVDKRTWNTTIWKLESPLAETCPLEEHLQWLLVELPQLDLQNEMMPADLKLTLDIAVFFDTAYCKAVVGHEYLQQFTDKGFGIEFTCYPCEEVAPENA